MPLRLLAFAVALSLTLPLVGCQFDSSDGDKRSIGGPVSDPEIEPKQVKMPVGDAPCTIHVEGYGDIDIEDDYIPNVVACENGNAPMEALKAQAVQARGYIYYKIFVQGENSVVNSEADQVFDCDYTNASDRHFAAAEATRGEYLEWGGEIVAPFYVAGAIPANQSDGAPEDACEGTGGDDPTSTEQWVTYNMGQTGCGIDMTELGWAPADCNDNPQNRGCGSQNGKTCLADRGWDYEQMLPYYYGDDIDLEVATGSCGGPGDPTEANLIGHCESQDDDGYSCMGDTRVECSGSSPGETEDCEFGCSGGQCHDPDEIDVFCSEQSDDGWACKTDSLRVECQGDEAAATETCTAGCEDNECAEPEESNGDNGENGDNGDDDNGDDDNGDDDNGDDDEDTSESINLVTQSPGIDGGGCSQTGAGATIPALAVVVLLLVALPRRRSDNSAHYLVP